MRQAGVALAILVGLAAVYGLSRLSQSIQRRQEAKEWERARQAMQSGEQAKETHEHAPSQGGKSEEHWTPAGLLGTPVRGPADAKVRILAVVPMGVECHRVTLQILEALAKAEPNRIRVETYDMGSPQGMQSLQARGQHCATIFVNDRCEFTFLKDGKKRTIVTQRKPNEPMSTYRSDDLVFIVDQELQQAYGKGFGQKAWQTVSEAVSKAMKSAGLEPAVSSVTPGPKKPRLTVEVLLPHEQAPVYTLFQESLKVLEKIRAKYPEDVTVQVYRLLTTEGQARRQQWGIKGPGIVMNGKVAHEILVGGKKRLIRTEYHGGIDYLFTPRDVETVALYYLKGKR